MWQHDVGYVHSGHLQEGGDPNPVVFLESGQLVRNAELLAEGIDQLLVLLLGVEPRQRGGGEVMARSPRLLRGEVPGEGLHAMGEL